MSKRKTWAYTDASREQVGRMTCTACQKPILAGQYRYRETAEAFLPQHRACSKDDPEWQKLDFKASERGRYFKDLLEASKAFRDRWQVTELDELIESLEAQ